MARVITVTNQKGGTGKTTTVEALAGGLALKGFRVLLIDLDPQCNLTYTVGAKEDGLTSLDVLMQKAEATDAVQHTGQGDIIPASRDLSGADMFITSTGKEYRLKEQLEAVQVLYDYILIDTPPTLGILTVNALVASDSVIIPAQADIYSLQGIEQLAETMKPVKKYCNPALRVAGILFTRYNPRSVLSREVAELAGELAQRLGTTVFRTTVREGVAVREAQISQQMLYGYAPKAKVTGDYIAFTEEFLAREKENGGCTV